MHTPITVEQYLGPYKDHPQMQSVVLLGNARQTVECVNEFCSLAEADGVELEDNPATGNAISGNGNGGARPSDTTVGAILSAHKDLRGLDRYDPRRALAKWALTYGNDHAQRLDLYFEHPQWTRSWLHNQWGAPGDGLTRWNVWFVPYADLVKNPPTCAALVEFATAGVSPYPFTEPRGRRS